MTLKGKSSLEILSNDNVLIIELIFSNIFVKEQKVLSDEIIVPFLSSFVADEKILDLDPKINKLENKEDNEEIIYLISRLNDIYKKIVEKENSCKLEQESNYNRNFSFKYYYYIYLWMKGRSISDICSNKIEEGKLYYIIMRTYYFVDQILNCYLLIENEIKNEIENEIKNEIDIEIMIKTFKKIKFNLSERIISVESLYLKNDIDIDNI